MFSSERRCPGCCLSAGVLSVFDLIPHLALNPVSPHWSTNTFTSLTFKKHNQIVSWQRMPIGSLSNHCLWKRCLRLLRTHLRDGFVQQSSHFSSFRLPSWFSRTPSAHFAPTSTPLCPPPDLILITFPLPLPQLPFLPLLRVKLSHPSAHSTSCNRTRWHQILLHLTPFIDRANRFTQCCCDSRCTFMRVPPRVSVCVCVRVQEWDCAQCGWVWACASVKNVY